MIIIVFIVFTISIGYIISVNKLEKNKNFMHVTNREYIYCLDNQIW